jgi:hypothetical protein
MVTVYAYVTVYAARIIHMAVLPSMPEVPVGLLVLMGISVTTATSSKGITVSYLQQNQLPTQDKSDLVSKRDGRTDLTKVQMLIWTFIAAVVYIVRINLFVKTSEFMNPNVTLPDVDSALMVLMGASQGGYIAGKLVSRTAAAPVIEHILPAKATASQEVSIEGNFFGDEKDTIILRDAQKNEISIPDTNIDPWNDVKVKFKVPPVDDVKTGKYSLMIRTGGRTSSPKDFEVI